MATEIQDNEIVVVCGVDENYAMPLAVTIRSAIDTLASDRRMRLFVLDGGIQDESKRRLEQSWKSSQVSMTWLEPDIEMVRDLPVSDHISIAAYLRLMLPELLPSSVSRVIYLDGDMLVRRDLSELWVEDLQGNSVLACQDYAAPFINSEACLANAAKCVPHMAAARPIANYQQLQIPSGNPYFNSGLLVIDVDDWRQTDVAGKVFDCLRTHREHVLWWDQYALNVVLAERWGQLDQRWNQGAHIYVYPNWQESPFDKETFARLRLDPWVVHFCSPVKPWQYFCPHPYTKEFYQCLRATSWGDFRPERPSQFVRHWWRHHYQPIRNQMKTTVVNVKKALGIKRSAA